MTTDQWAAVVGFVLPALVAIINREPWAPWIKGLVALATSILVGTITALLAGQFTGATWFQAIVITFAASQVAYHTWWKGTEIAAWIESHVAAGPPALAGKHEAPELGGTPGDSGGQ